MMFPPIAAAAGLIAGTAAVTAQTPQCFLEQTIPDQVEPEDYYGTGVDIGRNHTIVGSINDGIDPANPAPPRSGAAFIYRRTGGGWEVQQRLKAEQPLPQESDRLGEGVSISGDIAIAAAPGWPNDDRQGAVFVFERDSNKPIDEQWAQQTFLTASDGQPGDLLGGQISGSHQGVAIEGDVIVAGAPGAEWSSLIALAGRAYVFRYDGQQWQEEAIIEPPQPQLSAMFGYAVAIRGETIAISSPFHNGVETNEGRVDLFTREFVDGSHQWVHTDTLTAANPMTNDFFGHSVEFDGRVLVVGAPVAINEDDFGFATVFFETDGQWLFETTLQPAAGQIADQFGFSVSVSGTDALIGARRHDHPNGQDDVGTAYLFQRSVNHDGTVDWNEVWQFLPVPETATPNDRFGEAVSINKNDMFIGAIGDQLEGELTGTNRGAVYINPDLPGCP